MSDRAEFEAWATTQPDLQLMRDSVDRYRESYTQQAWIAWQAQEARYRPVVEALRELVACRVLKDRINVHLGTVEPGDPGRMKPVEYIDACAEYTRRKKLAWEAALSALLEKKG